MNLPLRRQTGLTLIELMVTLAMVAILAAIGVPAFRDHARNATVSRAAASFIQAAHLARANAMRRSRFTLLALRDKDRGWTAGWRVFTDMDNDQSYTAVTDELVYEQGPLADGVQVDQDDKATGTLADGYLRFDPGGFPRAASNGTTSGTISFVLPHARSVRVIYSHSGRIRRCNIGTPDCPRNGSS